MNKFIEFLLISVVTIVSILILLLFKQKSKDTHTKILIVFFIVLLNCLLVLYAIQIKFDILILITFPIANNIEFILGPLIYFYIESLFYHRKKLKFKHYLHFLPAVLYCAIFTIPELFTYILNIPLFKYLKITRDNDNLLNLLLNVYLITYNIISKVKYNYYLKAFKNLFSVSSINNIKWVNHMLIGTIAITGFALVIDGINLFFNQKNETYYFSILMAAILIVYLGYYGTNHSKFLLPEGTLKLKPNQKKLKPTETIALKQQLNLLFDKEKIHQDENLNLQKLADAMHINHKKLSYLLNNHLHTNFYELINKKRIEDVKQKMEDPAYQHHNMIEIAYECGFQSKASFNRIFKKETNQSPTEYKKTLKKEDIPITA